MKRRIEFDRVQIKAVWRYKKDGKRKQITKTFWQTINLFNLNSAGQIKTREEILSELHAQRNQWLDDMEESKVSPL